MTELGTHTFLAIQSEMMGTVVGGKENVLIAGHGSNSELLPLVINGTEGGEKTAYFSMNPKGNIENPCNLDDEVFPSIPLEGTLEFYMSEGKEHITPDFFQKLIQGLIDNGYTIVTEMDAFTILGEERSQACIKTAIITAGAGRIIHLVNQEELMCDKETLMIFDKVIRTTDQNHVLSPDNGECSVYARVNPIKMKALIKSIEKKAGTDQTYFAIESMRAYVSLLGLYEVMMQKTTIDSFEELDTLRYLIYPANAISILIYARTKYKTRSETKELYRHLQSILGDEFLARMLEDGSKEAEKIRPGDKKELKTFIKRQAKQYRTLAPGFKDILTEKEGDKKVSHLESAMYYSFNDIQAEMKKPKERTAKERV